MGTAIFRWEVSDSRSCTVTAAPAVTEDSGMLAREVQGWMVMTHSCDIVDRGAGPGFVQVVPLVEMEDDRKLRQVEKRSNPRLAFIPGVAHLRLVADLTRVQTVDRRLLDGWERIPGCRSDEERRDLANALRRKYGRLAAPDDFVPGRTQRTSTGSQRPRGVASRSLRRFESRPSRSGRRGLSTSTFGSSGRRSRLKSPMSSGISASRSGGRS